MTPNLAALIQNFTLSWDLGVIIFLFVAVFIYGFSAGQRRIGLLLVSVYFAYVLADIFPYLRNLASRLGEGRESFAEAGVFLALVFVLFLILAGSVLRSTLGLPKKEEGQWWHLAVLSVATCGLLSASFLALLPISYYNNLSTITKEVFIENFAHFSWAVTGVLVLVLLKRTKK